MSYQMRSLHGSFLDLSEPNLGSFSARVPSAVSVPGRPHTTFDPPSFHAAFKPRTAARLRIRQTSRVISPSICFQDEGLSKHLLSCSSWLVGCVRLGESQAERACAKEKSKTGLVQRYAGRGSVCLLRGGVQAIAWVSFLG